jgi:hypothetical protein
MFETIPDGQKLSMGQGAVCLEGILLRHRNGEICFTVEPLHHPHRKNITPHHLMNYFNKYVGRSPPGVRLWVLLTLADGPNKGLTMEQVEAARVSATAAFLPALPDLPAPLEAERMRILGELEKWRGLLAAYEIVRRHESRFAAEDEADLAKKMKREETNVQYMEMRLVCARGGVKLAKERMAAVVAKRDARAAELAAAKELIAKITP